MVRILAAGLLVACGSPVQVELERERAAVDVWDRAVASADAGDPAAATTALERVAELAPNEDAVLLFQAKLAADAGDFARAIDLASRVIAADDEHAVAWYNRAAWRARSGETASSAQDLARALELGARPPEEVLADPDFAGVLSSTLFDFVPRPGLRVEVEAPRARLFWGTEAQVRLSIEGAAADRPVDVSGPATGPVRLQKVVEDWVEASSGPQRVITWSFIVTGAGRVEAGPLTVRSGELVSEVAAFGFDTAAPSEKPAPASSSIAWFDTFHIDPFAGTQPLLGRVGELPRVAGAEGAVVVAAGTSDAVLVTPPSPPVRYERRRDGVLSELFWRWPAEARVTSVSVRRGTRLLGSWPSEG
jgi:hypothetical protein